MATTHSCGWPGCGKHVPLDKWGCPAHWFRLPPVIRSEIWAAYRSPEGALGDAYKAAIARALVWIASQPIGPRKHLPSTPLFKQKRLFTEGNHHD